MYSEDTRIRFARSISAGEPSLRLYAILDAESCARRNLPLLDTARALHDAGVRLIQYRDKLSSQAEILRNAQQLRKLLSPSSFFLLNDHVHLVLSCEADGVHVGQTDCAVERARELLGSTRLIGTSTHTPEQVIAAQRTDCDYVAIGPVFRTQTKLDADPVVGLCGVQAARAVVQKPLVAIGGIGVGDARAVEMAGADSVCVISALLPQQGSLAAVTRTAQDFLARLK